MNLGNPPPDPSDSAAEPFVSGAGISRAERASLRSFRKPGIALVSTETGPSDGFVFERLEFEVEGAGRGRALLTRPARSSGPFPAVLYGHPQGGRREVGANELARWIGWIDPAAPSWSSRSPILRRSLGARGVIRVRSSATEHRLTLARGRHRIEVAP